MPATRPHLDRDLKRKQILDAADDLFLRDGYDSTAMAAVARGAGVANNAVYWYFPSKDDLLAAVLMRRQEHALAQLAGSETGAVEERVLAAVRDTVPQASIGDVIRGPLAGRTIILATHRHLGTAGASQVITLDALGLADIASRPTGIPATVAAR